MSYEARVKLAADIIWQGRKVEMAPGICKFCGERLPYSYRVIKNGEVFETKPGSKAEQRAITLLDDGEKEGVLVFPISACEIMCQEDLYWDAKNMTNQWRDTWKKNQKTKRNESLKETTYKNPFVQSGKQSYEQSLSI